MPKMFAQLHKSFMVQMGQEHDVVIEDDVPMRHNVVIRGGTSLTTMYLGTFQGRSYIMTANVGDSDAFLFTRKDGVYRSKKLTVTHEPTSLDEYRRVQQFRELAAHFVYDTIGSFTVAGHLPIFEADGTMIDYEDTYTPYIAATKAYQNAWHAVDRAKKAGQPTEALRVELDVIIADYKMKKTKYDTSLDSRRMPNTARGDRSAYIMMDALDANNNLKLAVTRCLGDFHGHKVGLTHVPDVVITWLDEEDLGDQAAFFMASDGVLDCYHMEELAQIVLTGNPSHLMSTFSAKSVELFHKCHDDMSFVMKHLK
jgi:serine/threonine protein phosphatase PrpC